MGCRLLSAQNCFRRSANRNNANNEWIVNSSGNVNTNNAYNANRCAPRLYVNASIRSAVPLTRRTTNIRGAESPALWLNKTATM